MPEIPLGFYFVKAAPATTWVVPHNLGRRPAVAVLDGSGQVIEGQIVHDTVNQVTLTFNTAINGSVTCS
jgi:hypothetical protein